MSRTATAVDIAGRRLTLTNLDKVLYPSGTLKAEVIDYYRGVAPLLLPHLTDRPLTLKRYPHGAQGPFFYQKRCPDPHPAWLRTARIQTKHEPIDFCLIDDVAGLAWLANLACLELHTYLYRASRPAVATMLVLDLDPGAPATIVDCCQVALALRELLQAQGLEVLVKVSGAKGLHLLVPLNGDDPFAHTKAVAAALAATMQRQLPELVTTTMAKSARTGKVFIDWSQNDQSKTTCCIYSLRAQAQPTVSAPVPWARIAAAAAGRDLAALVVTAAEQLSRVARGDPALGLETIQQRLPQALGTTTAVAAPAARPRVATTAASATARTRPRGVAKAAKRPRSHPQPRGRTKPTGWRKA